MGREDCINSTADTQPVLVREVVLAQIRKHTYRDPRQTSPYLRALLWIQQHLTWILIRSGVSSRAVTVCWFVVALIGYAVTAYGAMWSFAVGALIVFVKILLDISDGEVGRYRSRFMDPATDLRTHIQGIYLDLIQHVVETPLWGVALGYGAYRQTGSLLLLGCGVCFGMHQGLSRIDTMLRRDLAATFKGRVTAQSWGTCAPKDARRGKAAWYVRGAGTLAFWVRNGKRFNLLVLLGGIADLGMHACRQRPTCIPALLVIAGSVSAVAVAQLIVAAQFGPGLVNDLLTGSDPEAPDRVATVSSPPPPDPD